MHNSINRLSVLRYAAGLLFLATTMAAGAQQYEIRYQALGLKPLTQTDFVSHMFTTCGQTGRLGPSLGICASAYNGAEILKPEYNYGVVDGIQQWTVPADGVYTFEIAAPSLHASLSSAKGSIITSKVSLIKGEIVHVVAGQRGVGAWPVTEGTSVNSNDGLGGAGGSFVYTGSIGGDGLIGAAGGGNLDCEPTSINGCLVRANDGHHGDLRTNRYSSGPGTGWPSSSGFAHVNV